MKDEKLPERAVHLCDMLVQHLNAIRTDISEIAEVRALGGIMAAEFKDIATSKPLPEFTKDIALEKGLLLLTRVVHGNVIRFLLPLTIQESVFDEGLALLAEALRQARLTSWSPVALRVRTQ